MTSECPQPQTPQDAAIMILAAIRMTNEHLYQIRLVFEALLKVAQEQQTH